MPGIGRARRQFRHLPALDRFDGILRFFQAQTGLLAHQLDRFDLFTLAHQLLKAIDIDAARDWLILQQIVQHARRLDAIVGQIQLRSAERAGGAGSPGKIDRRAAIGTIHIIDRHRLPLRGRVG